MIKEEINAVIKPEKTTPQEMEENNDKTTVVQKETSVANKNATARELNSIYLF